MKLTLTREQIPLAWETVAWLRDDDDHRDLSCDCLPGYEWWLGTVGSVGGVRNGDWADALEAAIKEAGGAQANDMFCMSTEGDERAFWQSACLQSLRSGETGERAVNAADQALAGYRKAFCTGMPSDQKGAK